LKIYEYFKLSEKEYEFCNTDLEKDTKLYVDPIGIQYLYENSSNVYLKQLSEKANKQIDAFFSEIARVHREYPTKDKLMIFKELFKNFKEPQHLRLGLSSVGNSGKGTTSSELVKIFNVQEVSDLFNTKSVNENLGLHSLSLLINYFGDDKLSDLTSNIIMNVIIEYNNVMFEKYKFFQDYINDTSIEYNYFCSLSKSWKTVKHFPLMINSKPLLLVPQKFVFRRQAGSLSRIISIYVEEPIINQTIYLPDGKEIKKTKKQYIEENVNGNRKEFAMKLVLTATDKYHKQFKSKIFSYIRERI